MVSKKKGEVDMSRKQNRTNPRTERVTMETKAKIDELARLMRWTRVQTLDACVEHFMDDLKKEGAGLIIKYIGLPPQTNEHK